MWYLRIGCQIPVSNSGIRRWRGVYRTSDWGLEAGDPIERKELHDQYGGRTQGGIGPSKQTPNVLIFSDPATGEKHGYFDDWGADGCYHYTGEGQFGDQRMVSGNASILRHREEGRVLRVFEGARGRVRYLGRFEVDPVEPWYETDAPETGGKAIRKVIVFRLRPMDVAPGTPRTRFEIPRGPHPSVTPCGVEQQWTEKFYVDPAGETHEAERREAKLVLQLRDYLRHHGHESYRHKIVPDGEVKPLFTDLYDATIDLVVEAKGTVTREAIRMSIGQLADYGRFLPAASRAILLPSRPRLDLESLGASQGIAFLWPADDGYRSNDEALARALA